MTTKVSQLPEFSKLANTLDEIRMIPMICPAIWHEKIAIDNGKKEYRLIPGMKVKIENGELVNCLDNIPTHQIICCITNIASTVGALTVYDLKTYEISLINISPENIA